MILRVTHVYISALVYVLLLVHQSINLKTWVVGLCDEISLHADGFAPYKAIHPTFSGPYPGIWVQPFLEVPVAWDRNWVILFCKFLSSPSSWPR